VLYKAGIVRGETPTKENNEWEDIMAKAIPDRYHTLTPSFTFIDAQKAIDFYKKAFGAKVMDLMPGLTGRGVMHATLQVGDSIMMMGDEMHGEQSPQSAETLGSTPITLYVYVPDVDA